MQKTLKIGFICRRQPIGVGLKLHLFNAHFLNSMTVLAVFGIVGIMVVLRSVFCSDIDDVSIIQNH